jgi:hypothetical protein
VSFPELREGQIDSVPKAGGIYVVLRERDDSMPIYLEQSVGGWFKQQDPTVAVPALKEDRAFKRADTGWPMQLATLEPVRCSVRSRRFNANPHRVMG